MFWDPVYWELRDSVKPYFEKLKQVGIFHETSESAAAKVKEIWDDVEKWWYKEETQVARRKFCEQFAYMPDRPFRVLKNAVCIL